jgi:glycine betaine/proline transport system ATP-binding protein
MRWIERVGLKGFENRYPNQLSGGMQQRVGLARALANDAPILLMDEAFSALDPLIRVDMQTVLLDLQKEIKKTIVFITHDLDEALRLGDRIAILRDGEVVQQGTGQDIVMKPSDEYIASFVREVNRARIIKAETVATATTDPRRELRISVPVGATLEEAARAMTSAGESETAVVNEEGRTIAVLTLRQAVDAMVNSQTVPANADVEKVA